MMTQQTSSFAAELHRTMCCPGHLRYTSKSHEIPPRQSGTKYHFSRAWDCNHEGVSKCPECGSDGVEHGRYYSFDLPRTKADA